MESQTYIKNAKISPKKLRFLLPEVKKLKPVVALDYLFYTRKKAAKIFYKSIASAISNAKSLLKVDPGLLEFKLLTIEEGQKLKRFKPGGRGGVKPIKRRFSHIKIILVAKSQPIEKAKKELTAKVTKTDKQIEVKQIKNSKPSKSEGNK
jgi:large subunit ribosomal protein L22